MPKAKFGLALGAAAAGAAGASGVAGVGEAGVVMSSFYFLSFFTSALSFPSLRLSLSLTHFSVACAVKLEGISSLL